MAIAMSFRAFRDFTRRINECVEEAMVQSRHLADEQIQNNARNLTADVVELFIEQAGGLNIQEDV